MSVENDDAARHAASAEWAALIAAIGARGDRAAFARLFEYFAPRIKTYMQRSGLTEAGAEELAQETMLTVWRKAALFDPASAGAGAWIFAIARNLRIDAFRRENRRGAVTLSEIEAEFDIDDMPLPDFRSPLRNRKRGCVRRSSFWAPINCGWWSCPSLRRRLMRKSPSFLKYRSVPSSRVCAWR